MDILFKKKHIKDNMESKKDNKGQYENKGLIKDSQHISNMMKDYSLVSNMNPIMLKKAEKISIASHLLTEHIEKDEPLRGRIRTCSINFLKDIHSIFEFQDEAFKNNLIGSASRIVKETLSLFEIAMLSRMVSANNYSVIKRELESFSDMLAGLKESYNKSIIFPETLFSGIEETALIGEPNKVEKTFLGEPRIKQTNVSYKGHITQKQILKDKKPEHNIIKDNNVKKTDRKETILKLIKKDKAVSIKDIYNYFTDCSEKTIQRELSKLVSEGSILRVGDKRWSRYSLA